MRVMSVCAALTAFAAAPALADGSASALPFPAVQGQSVSQNLDLGVTQADGTVDVVLAAAPDPDRLDYFLSLLVLGTAEQVRFSVTYDANERQATVGQIESFIEANGVPWHMCHGWWLSPDDDYAETVIRDELGGSVILIDNGQSSDVVDNPEADMEKALTADPVFTGVFGPQPVRVEDMGDYFKAVSAIWGQVVPNRELDSQRQERGGWVDGC